MEVGKTYKVIIVFKYDVYESTVKCLEVLPKSYRVWQGEEIKLIRKSNILKACEI